METLSSLLNLIILDSDVPRWFGIKVYDKDLFELMFRLGLNILVALIIIFFVYKPSRNDREYYFTYLIFSPIVFFICHLFASVDLSIGFAFGLFAVFSILRYRTTTILVKEMTYIFIIIAVAVINALSTKKVSFVELFFTNGFIVMVTWLVEKYFGKNTRESLEIDYEIIDHIKPENKALLLETLNTRLGLNVLDVQILEADYMRDMARLRVYYKEK